jgi:hypothetical protein
MQLINEAPRGTQELLTVEDLATRLRVPRSWVYSHSEDLGAYKLGKYVRFDWERVRERLTKLGQQPSDPILGSSNARLNSAIERICNK